MYDLKQSNLLYEQWVILRNNLNMPSLVKSLMFPEYLILLELFVGNQQKWSKGKVRDKLNNLVLFDKATYDKLYKEVPSYRLITPSVVSERLKIRGSLARRGLEELLSKGLIREVSKHHAQLIYTRATKGNEGKEGAQ